MSNVTRRQFLFSIPVVAVSLPKPTFVHTDKVFAWNDFAKSFNLVASKLAEVRAELAKAIDPGTTSVQLKTQARAVKGMLHTCYKKFKLFEESV